MTTSGEADDKIKVGNGNDTISAGADSSIRAGNGNDTVAAGAGSMIALGNGNDLVNAAGAGPGRPGSMISLGNGNDMVTAGREARSPWSRQVPSKNRRITPQSTIPRPVPLLAPLPKTSTPRAWSLGAYTDSSTGVMHGFLYSGDAYMPLPDDPSASTLPGQRPARAPLPSGINDLGQVVGFYVDSGGVDHGFFYSGACMVTTKPSTIPLPVPATVREPGVRQSTTRARS